MASAKWQVLRDKTDETVDDTDWAGTNTAPADSICAIFEPIAGGGLAPYTGVEVAVIGLDGSNVAVNRSTMTVDIAIVEVAEAVSSTGATTSYVIDSSSASTTAVPLNRPCYFEMNGGKFTVRLTNDANEAVDTWRVIWRPVTR